MSRSQCLLLLGVGCGGGADPAFPDAEVPVDSTDYHFSCLDDFPLTTAPDPTSIGGIILNGDDKRPVPGIAVDVIRESDGAIIASAVTDGNGEYAVSVGTGGSAIEVSRRLTGVGFTAHGLRRDRSRLGCAPGPATVAIVQGTTAWRTRSVVVEAGGLTLSFRSP